MGRGTGRSGFMVDPARRIASARASVTRAHPPRIATVTPALDEEGAIGQVVSELVRLTQEDGSRLVEEVVVADNASRDRTAEVARAAGAVVVDAPIRGYGAACLSALGYLRDRSSGPPDVVVFVDGDGSNDAGELRLLVAPVLSGEADLVIGSRVRLSERGALTLPQRVGNRVAAGLLRLLYDARATDLGPFRAISWPALVRVGMEDLDYGWTVEMQVKAAKCNLRVVEVDVHNRSRVAGKSKVAGTLRGVVGAGTKIIYTILKYR